MWMKVDKLALLCVTNSANFVAMQSVHPSRILLILLIAAAILVGVMALFPNGVVMATDSFTLRFFSWNKLTHPGPDAIVDITDIIQAAEEDAIIDTVITPVVTTTEDTLPQRDTTFIPPAAAIIARQKLEYPSGNDTLLQSFYTALDRVRTSGKQIRILHFGDSQVEGDRITQDIRQKFHTDPNFGGCGSGLLPIMDILQGRLSIRQETAGDWYKYSVYLPNPQRPPYRDYGILGNYFRYLPFVATDSFPPGDTIPLYTLLVDTIEHSASITFTRSNMGYAAARMFTRASLLYSNNAADMALSVIWNDLDTQSLMLPATTSPQWLAIPNVPDTFASLTIRFSGFHSPDLYGVSLDCGTGVMVDNIGMRGSSVPGFARMNTATLRRQLQLMNVQLIILQFGVNVVPYETDSYSYYERMYAGNLAALKRAAPDIPVIVIGVNDMAKKEGLEILSYPNIPLIKEAQRQAAFRNGCAFWDLQAAMGGENAMVSWAQNDPPLAADDYTHFSPQGARIIGKMIVDAIMEPYYAGKKNQ